VGAFFWYLLDWSDTMRPSMTAMSSWQRIAEPSNE
jgi:hypothetical protein